MNVQIQTVHFDADERLLEHVQKRLDKLKTFHDRITGVEVYLRLENLSQKVRDKVAEIKVFIPKHALFAKHESKVFEESFDEAFDSMVSQIKRQKEKMIV
ncbi:ribosome hibernation-promoting factor, HPF/YfiA family [Taibaiella chishuiensis]|uniref:Putative sigma-54 modulation protein n=1 Tax=Taibaiella chishuiensis TaxID=1434707 RepID=A0A2P8DDC2_9BACT|nr:ribosome-associated translation inhibitor RaiA [Taibaiella chishuiensis]PSK95202.1 putative sigma-54 modulation protein [Taibaiella chishuiensis]